MISRRDYLKSAGSGFGMLALTSLLAEQGLLADEPAAINPLASVSTIGKIGRLNLSGSAAAEVAVEATISGDFQIRVQALGESRVRLGLTRS